jgi:hypothetical protein
MVPLAALAAGVALLMTLPPWILGGSAHRAYQGLVSDLLVALPPGSVVTEQYERGWFRSRASTELVIQPGTHSPSPLRVRIDSRIDQGPLHWLHSGLPPALARVESRVDLLDQQVAPPLRVVTDLGLHGGTASRLHLPAIDQPGIHAAYRLRSGALTGSLRLEPGSGGLELDLDLPLAELTGPQGTIARVEALRLTSSLRSQPADPGSGSGRALIGSAQAGSPAPGAGTPGGAPPEYPRDARLDLRLTLNATALSLDGESLREPRLGLIAEGLDGAALVELTTGLQALSTGEAPQAVRRLLGAALLAQWLPRLAAGQPRILIDPARVDTTEGPLAVRLSLALGPTRSGPDPSGPRGGTSPTDPRDWLGALMAEGEIELPEALARRWLTPGDAGTGPRPGELGTPRSATLQSWLDGGWVSQRDGRIASAFRLADGLLSVNGKTVPLFGLPSTRLR